MPLSDKKKITNDRYLEKFEEIKFRRPKGERDIIKAFAESKGMSLNAYINKLIDEDMNKPTE